MEKQSPVDDKSTKSIRKSKARKKMTDMSAGRKSLNDSAIDMSGGASQLGVMSGDQILMN